MHFFHGRARVLLLATALTAAVPLPAFASQSAAAHLHVIEAVRPAALPGGSDLKAVKKDRQIFSNYFYNEFADQKAYMAKVNDFVQQGTALAQTAQDEQALSLADAAAAATAKKEQLAACVKTLKKLVKQARTAKNSIHPGSVSVPALYANASLFSRIDYAQEAFSDCRRDLKKDLKSAKKEEKKAVAAYEEALAQEAARAEAARQAAYLAQLQAQEEAAAQAAQEAQAETELPADAQYAQETENISEPADESQEEYAQTAGSEGDQEYASDESTQSDGAYEEEYETSAPEETSAQEEYSQTTEETQAAASADTAEETASYSGSSSSGWSWPVSGTTVTSSYGEREAPIEGASTFHQGIDIDASEGDDISAAASGTVSETGYNDAMGNYVVIDHGDGVSTTYEHCSDVYAEEGQSVSQGETIGAVGSTGITTGSHLHFGVSVNDESVDPSDYYQ